MTDRSSVLRTDAANSARQGKCAFVDPAGMLKPRRVSCERSAVNQVTLARPNPYRTIVTRQAVWQQPSNSSSEHMSGSQIRPSTTSAVLRRPSPSVSARSVSGRSISPALNGDRKASSMPMSSQHQFLPSALENFWERLTAEHILKVVSELSPCDVNHFVARKCHLVCASGSASVLRPDDRNDVIDFLRKHFGLRNAVASSREPLVTSALVGHRRLPPASTWSAPVRRFVHSLRADAQESFFAAIEQQKVRSSDVSEKIAVRRVAEVVLERVWMSLDDATQIAEEVLGSIQIERTL
ncbi:Hypothetical protein, putative [Bodo saltans]|uniref:Uncharacterized protein n=1 Tax=Bodo saltans TaxID=75058 RepID=A0A0S4J564_BODSA|nr:Hypothetical protein, putative [Bodo saltans]|eukprot:CUG80990.1 Hypothetical protein, putative [Bodo saltans]